MDIRHKSQRSGKASVPGQVFDVQGDGVLVPRPTPEQSKMLLASGMFEKTEVKKPEPKKEDPKPASKKAALRNKK